MNVPRREADNGRLRGKLFILGAAVLWSFAGVFIKSFDLPALTIVFYRSLFAGVFFLLFVRTLRVRAGRPLALSALSYTAAISSFVWANQLTSAGNAIVLQYTAPIFVFVLARVLLRESVSQADLRTLFVGMIGTAVIFLGSAREADLPGVAIATLSGFLFGLYMTSLKFLREVPPVLLTCANNAACCLILLPFVYSHLALTAEQCLALAVMGVVQLGIPYFLFSKGVESVPVQEASLIALIEPVLNPIWVALVVRELPGPPTLAGGAIILSGLAFRYLRGNRFVPAQR
jgi:drug/metabolite transporter (DMT)-like permease